MHGLFCGNVTEPVVKLGQVVITLWKAIWVFTQHCLISEIISRYLEINFRHRVVINFPISGNDSRISGLIFADIGKSAGNQFPIYEMPPRKQVTLAPCNTALPHRPLSTMTPSHTAPGVSGDSHYDISELYDTYYSSFCIEETREHVSEHWQEGNYQLWANCFMCWNPVSIAGLGSFKATLPPDYGDFPNHSAMTRPSKCTDTIYKSLHGLTPSYLTEKLSSRPNKGLRSDNQ